jgi:predicted ATP-grasp superfamily ATP-dependent carboligase
VLQVELARYGIPAVGLWAEVPHYIATNPHPPAALALAERVADALGVALDTTELRAAAALHLEQVADAVAEHEDAASMVSALEEMVDAGETDEDLPSGDDLAAEIENFLEARRDD